ncbi:LysR family transcriptional regulator [Prescottella defluvii]|nr:LysR family transcriptional regulator [Prescottella defluvii]
MSSFLNLTLVNSLEVLIEEGSFARAAARLFVSPPAMTQQIQRLEGAVGYKLVERGTAPIRLTDRGREFMVHAGAALASSRIALGERTEQEILRIGFINGFPGRRDEGFLADFAAKNPHARLQFIQLEWGDQLSRLARRRRRCISRPSTLSRDGGQDGSHCRASRETGGSSADRLATRGIWSVDSRGPRRLRRRRRQRHRP